jgi:hypothetical protein
VTGSPHRLPFFSKGLRKIQLIGGSLVSENLTKIRVKFLKFHPVERLWNAVRKFCLLDAFQKQFRRGESLSIFLEPLHLRSPLVGDMEVRGRNKS